MKEQRRVYKALAQARKEELSSEKVELAAAEDIKKMVSFLSTMQKSFNSDLQKMVDGIQEFASAQRKLDSSFSQAQLGAEDAQDLVNRAEKLITDAATKAKELGLDPRKVFPEADRVVDIVADLEDSIAIFERNESDAKRILAI